MEAAHLFDLNFTFKSRPIPVSPELRPMWMIAKLSLALHLACRGGRASVLKLHLLHWATATDGNLSKLISLRDGAPELIRFSIRPDPFVTRAVAFACADSFFEQYRLGSVQLSYRGHLFAGVLSENNQLLAEERERLRNIGKSISESTIKQAFRGR